jgi:oxalate decarboxylase/phosphoglucose isomerase-like protein (cupin superfamily)
MKINIHDFKGEKVIMKVKDAIKEGKNIYKNIKGHENEINEVLADLPNTGLKDIIVCMNFLYPGNINGEFKMTRGHKHDVDEVYIVLKGKGYIILDKKKFKIKEGDLITIPDNRYHRTVNTGKEKLVFLTMFEKHKVSHLKSY